MTETIKGAKELAKFYYQHDIPMYAHGAPGIGKSDLFKQLAKELGIGFVIIRFSDKLPRTLSGIPVPDLEQRMAVWLKAEFFPNAKRDGEKGILCFDEMSDAHKGLQSCAYQIILDRKINDFELPKGWWPVAAGNRREDRAAAQSLSTALANRFAHIEIIPDHKAWIEWANKANIDELVTGFIHFRPELLHKMEGADLLRFPTPRTWTQVAKICRAPETMRYRLVESLVGSGPAGEFETYMKALDLPAFEEVVKNPKKCHVPVKPSSKYAMTSMLARHVDMKTMGAVVEYIGRKEFGREFATLCMMDATERESALCDTKAWAEWSNKNKDVHL